MDEKIRKQKKAVVAGSFDPFTNGHLHIVRQAADIFDSVDVAVFSNRKKNRHFYVSDMVQAMNEVFDRTEGLENCRAVDMSEQLLARYCMQNDIHYSVRGLRSNTDYEYEETIAKGCNIIYPHLKTIYVRAADSAISSSLVMELAYYEEPISSYIPPEIQKLFYTKNWRN